MTLAVVVKGWPRLSETFIAQELQGLERHGLSFDIWSLRHPTDKVEHSIHRRIAARRQYLPEYLRNEPLRVAIAVLSQAWRPRFWRAVGVWLHDLARARDLNRIRRFGQAAVLARELPGSTLGIYAHFLHTPTSVARYASIMRGLPFAVSAHAKDIWTTADWEKREKLESATFTTTCTASGADHLKALAPSAEVALVYHGLDTDTLPAARTGTLEGCSDDAAARQGPATARPATPSAPFRLVSVGRLVEKKGFDTLLDALARLAGEIDWRWTHVGGGAHGPQLRERADALGLSERIDWRGALDREGVFDALAGSDLFVLPSRIAADGDRDGLPNVLMEAAHVGVPVLSTAVSAIPEFVTDGESGVLVPPDDPVALADAIARLAADPEGRAGMAGRLRARLHADFDAERGIAEIAGRLKAMLA